MKILIVTERYWPEVGAAPSRLANMAEGLKNRGNKVDVLTSLPNYPKGSIFDEYRKCLSKKEVHNGVTLFRYWMYATVSRSPIARIINMFSFAIMLWIFGLKRKRIKEYDIFIIQTPTLIVASSAMMLFKGIYRKKCYINVSDIWPLTAVDMGAMKKDGHSYKFMRWCEHYLYRKCDGVLGQSEEILNHVAQERINLGISSVKHEFRENDTDQILNSKLWQKDQNLFLYRNLQTYQLDYDHKIKEKVTKIVFCGMLGVAQNVAGIINNVPFKDLGVEFHILGGGKQYEEIQQWCVAHPDGNVYVHGFIPKEQIAEQLRDLDGSIVPLVTRIRGAVPSKIYDILPQGLPILFCGDGEGASFIKENNVGFTCTSGDYTSLTENIKRFKNLSKEEYEDMSARCIKVSKEKLNFEKQLDDLQTWLRLR